MAIEARKITGKNDFGGEVEWLEDGPTGLVGGRDFWVNTALVELARTAIGAPFKGQLWSPELPLCACVSVRSQYVQGREVTSEALGGVCLLRARYETPGAMGRIVVPEAGTAYTEWAPGSQSVTVYHDMRAPQAGYEAPLANGDGVSKEVPTLDAVVYRYEPLNQPFNTGLWRSVMGKTNNNPVVLPPDYGAPSSGTYLLAPGQLRYKGFAINQRYGLREVAHSFAADLDHLVRWMLVDENGDAVSVQQSQVYEAAAFPALT